MPVRIDKVDPPLGFGETQAVDLHGWKGERDDPQYRAVLGALRKRLGIKSEPERSAAAQPRRFSRRTVIGGTAAAGAVAVGAGGWFFLRPSAGKSDSIAVLPFANLSGDPNQAYFSDGIAEELRSALSRIAGLKVVARTSSEAVRDEDTKTAARKLDVRNILTGSVRRSPSLIRISAQLIDGGDGTELWSQDYDRPSGDALQIQAQRGQHDSAFAALNLALRTPDPGLITLLSDPFLDPIRSDPRFARLRSKIDFPT